MNKYQQLGQYLSSQSAERLPMTFAEIERVVGTKLPPSAYRHRPWWSNNPSNSVMTRVWIDAGYRTEQVDMEGRKLVFKREASGRPGVADTHLEGAGMAEHPQPFVMGSTTPRRHPLFGALKGTFTIAPGVDLTQPAMPEWADLIDEKYGKGPNA